MARYFNIPECSGATGSTHAALPISAGQRVVWSGDSLSVPVTGYVVVLQALITAAFTAASQAPPVFVNTAIAGQSSASILTDVVNQLITPAPDHVFLLIGTNDLGGGVTGANVAANINGIMDAVLASLPNCKFHIVSIPWGDYWPNGADPLDGRKAEINDAEAGVARAYTRPTEYINIRPDVLAWEAANNPSHLTSGLLTQDGVHPTQVGARPAGQSGQEVWSAAVYAQIALSVPK